MSIPNPPNASRMHRRHAYRRFSDERIWREFFAICLSASARLLPDKLYVAQAAAGADVAYAEFRNRFPVRELEDDEPAEAETEGASPQ
jgi:hypothetical protein